MAESTVAEAELKLQLELLYKKLADYDKLSVKMADVKKENSPHGGTLLER